MASRPNILFVLADQLGARWLPVHGHPVVLTPHLDKFASQSTVFERAITSSPVCTPYRACLLSGLYPSQTGVLENGQAYPPDVPSVADHLNRQGYTTTYIGKWHLSGAPQENRWVPPANRAGFQKFIGWESHHIDHYAGLIWSDAPDGAIKMPGHETDALTAIARKQLEDCARDNAPFFLMVSYQAPHPPCSPPAVYADLYTDVDLLSEPNVDRGAWFKHDAWNADYDIARFRQLYFGEISQLDAAFGRLLSALDVLDLSDNTLVIFTSDHGEMAGAHGLFGKGLMFEESLHVPLIARAPGQEKSRQAPCPVATVDLMPTLLDYAGGASNQNAAGISLRAHIEGAAPDEERVVISEYHNFCATSGEWKLFTRGRTLEHAAFYHVVDDPFELRNHLDDPAWAEARARLSAALTSWHESRMKKESHPEESENRWHRVNT